MAGQAIDRMGDQAGVLNGVEIVSNSDNRGRKIHDNIHLRSGEAYLEKRIFEDDSLNNVILKALERGMTFEYLKVDRVTRNGLWVSTAESTVQSIVLYLHKGEENYLIVKRSDEEKYGLFRYSWTP